MRRNGVGIPAGFLGMVFILGFSTFIFYKELKKANFRVHAYHKLLAGFAIVFFTVSVVPTLSSEYFDLQIFFEFFRYAIFLMLGLMFPMIFNACRGSERFLSIHVAILFFAMIFLNIDWKMGELEQGQDEELNYIRIAAACFYLFLLMYTVFPKGWQKFLIYTSGTFLLFYIKSRLWFYPFLVVPAVYYLLKGKFLRSSTWMLIHLTTIYFIVFGFVSSGSRQAALITKPFEDSSLNTRLRLLMDGLQQMDKHPISGFYNGFLKYAGEGHYIHNILSFWHSYGLLSFVLLVAMLIYCFKVLFLNRKTDEELIISASIFFIFISFSYLVARSVMNSDIFFGIGVAISTMIYISDRRANEHSIEELSR